MRVSVVQNNLAFKSKDVVLYSDFDGTFLQPGAINNDYFQAFDEFRRERDGKFKIFITTGRRLQDGFGHGFLDAYENLKSQNLDLPKLEGVITAGGGDMFCFKQNGEIDSTPHAGKRALVKTKTGWDVDFVLENLRNIAQNLKTGLDTSYSRGFHRLALSLDEPMLLEEFADEAERFFEQNQISAQAKVREIAPLKEGVKIAPLFMGHRIHKDFDIFAALEKAQRENDFIVVAGNETNDKELLNLFNYIGERKINSCEKIPKSGLEGLVERINKLPIGVVFVDSPVSEVSSKLSAFKKFIEAQQKLFPDKVRIVKLTESGGENSLVQATRELTKKYFADTPPQAAPTKPPAVVKTGNGKYVALGVILGLTAGGAGGYYLKKHIQTKKD